VDNPIFFCLASNARLFFCAFAEIKEQNKQNFGRIYGNEDNMSDSGGISCRI
jgi:hypothetical protein